MLQEPVLFGVPAFGKMRVVMSVESRVRLSRPLVVGPPLQRAVVLWQLSGFTSIALLVLVGSLGPSAAVVPLQPQATDLAAPWPVAVLMCLSALTGVVCVWSGLVALDRGWKPSPRRLLCVGMLACVGLMAVPPLGNGDIGSYAAYGRAAALGASPYTTSPSDFGDDPVATAAEPPWQDQPSVYGPIATGQHALAALAGRDSRPSVLRLLAVSATLVFLSIGFLLTRRAVDAPRTQVLWTCNPLLLLHLVGAAHVDVLLCLFVLLAVTSRRGWMSTGLALTAATCVKITGVLTVAAVVVAKRRRALPVVLVAVVSSTAFHALLGGWATLGPVFDARHRVSAATPWRWAASACEVVLPDEAARTLVSIFVAFLGLAFVHVLHKDLPTSDPLIRTSAVLWLAYLFAAGYQLPWYDSVGFLLLALLGASRWDQLLLSHTLVLTVAYLPGRVVPLPDGLDQLLVLMRSGLSPLGILVIWYVALSGSRTPDMAAGVAPRSAG